MNHAHDRSGFTLRELVVVIGIIAVLIALVVPAVRQARDVARKSQWQNNLKSIGLALYNYHDSYGCFPPGGTFAADGTAYHSWFTLLHPFYEAGPLPPWDLKTPWDDPEEIEYFMKPHPIAMDPRIREQSSADGLALIHCAANEWLMCRNRSFNADDVAHKSGTLLIADAYGDFPPWARPYNWRDPLVPFRTSKSQFGGSVKSATHVLFADGAVRIIDSTVDPAVQAAWAGPPERKPSQSQIATPFRIPSGGYWKTETIYKVSVDKDGGFSTASYVVQIRRDPAGIVRRVFDSVCCKVDSPHEWPCGPTPGDSVVEEILKFTTVEDLEMRYVSDAAAERLAKLPSLKNVHLTEQPERFRR
ncbi:MAG: DUF1559 domain-containing protein [Planctomycetaceae bacterium]|nr:DUF1559 domain-containing protein [Planctomycetaceae bacterium]